MKMKSQEKTQRMILREKRGQPFKYYKQQERKEKRLNYNNECNEKITKPKKHGKIYALKNTAIEKYMN